VTKKKQSTREAQMSTRRFGHRAPLEVLIGIRRQIDVDAHVVPESVGLVLMFGQLD
jgi:hypothetical protein